MQASKTRSRRGPSDVNQRTSPSTPKSNCRSKLTGPVSDSGTSPHASTKTTTNGSPRVAHSRSPKSPVLEKKLSSKVLELESQISLLQEDLRKTKEQLNSSELSKKQAQEEAEEARIQAAIMAAKAEETQPQLRELPSAEELYLQDVGSLEDSIDEMQKLKSQLDSTVKSKDALAKEHNEAQSELQYLRLELGEKGSVIQKLEFQLRDGAQAHAETKHMLSETVKELELTKNSEETLLLDILKLKESLNSNVSELEESRAKILSMQESFISMQNNRLGKNEGFGFDLEEFECKHWEDETVSMLRLESALELVKDLRSECELREAELESDVRDRKMEADELKAKLTEKEAQLENVLDTNKDLNSGLERNQISQMESELCQAELKLEIMNKETALKSMMDENELLKLEIGKKEMENRKAYEEALEELELARSGEQEAIMRLGYATTEADKSSRRAAKSAEQVDALQTKNSEMEAELRRLRVQSDQWRKAAEAAAAILTSNENGRFVDRTGSLGSEYYAVRKLMSSPYADDLMDCDSPKRKSSGMLRKIGGFWKKNQK